MNSPFRRRGPSGPALSPDEGKRQGRAVRAAQSALSSVEAVRAFLNSHHQGLGSRPLDLAVESEIGLAGVEALLSAGGTPPLRRNRSPSNRAEVRS